MAGNPFDRFDTQSNPFDRFDAAPTGRRVSALEGFATGFADASTFGFGDEALGATRASLQRRRGETWSQAYERYVQESRDQQRAAQDQQGLAVLGGNVAAFMVPGAPAMQATRLAGRGANALLRGVNPGAAAAAARTGNFLSQSVAGRAILGGASGAAAGAVYGGASATEGQRLNGAGVGALQGAIGGAVGAPVFEGLGYVARPVFKTAQNALMAARGNAPAAARNILSDRSGSAQIPPSLTGAPADQGGPSNLVADHLLRLLERGQITPDEFERRLAEAAADGGRKVVANVAGVNSRDALRTVSRMPGQTPEAADKTFDEIGGTQFDDIMRAFRETSGARNTRFGMSQDIQEAMRRVGDEGYKPALAQPVSDDAWAAFEGVRQRMPPPVRGLADDIIDEITEGRGIAALSRGEQMHIQKQALDQAMNTLEREGLDGLRLSSRRQLKGELLDVIEGALPGYRQAREEFGDLYAGKRALTAAKSFTSADPEELMAQVSTMTPFEREAFKASVLTEVRKALAGRDRGTQTNVALALADRQRRELLRSVFDTDEEFQAFIRVLDDRAEMIRQNNRMRPGTGSDTFGNAATAGDLPSSRGDALNRVARVTVGRAFGTDEARLAQERFRDELGSALLLRTRDTDSTAALVAALRRATKRRQEQAAAATSGGFTGAIGGGNVLDQY